jgi:hypothetical protein
MKNLIQGDSRRKDNERKEITHLYNATIVTRWDTLQKKFPARREEYKRKQKRYHAHAVEDEESPAKILREQIKEHVLISTLLGLVTPGEDTWLIDSGASKHMT